MKHVIIGNGAAGIDAALTLRKNSDSDEILVISKSEYPHYYRPNTIEYLEEEYKSQDGKNKLILHKDNFLENKNIKCLLNTKIIKIDHANKIITDSKNNSHAYDKLLLATGGYPFIPPLQGVNSKGVFTMHGINDADNIKEFTRENSISHITIIGGGLLGLETANILLQKNIKVNVIEVADRLLPKQLDVEGALILKKLLEKRGINFIINEKIKCIESDNNDQVSAVCLHNNQSLKTDAVIISTGILPVLDLAINSDIQTNSGIIVNNLMQTSVQDIYAAGDAIEFNSKRFGLWMIAKEQAVIAANNMQNIEKTYVEPIMNSTLKIKGVEMLSAGIFDDSIYEYYINKTEESYVKIYADQTSIKGIIVIGNKEVIKKGRKLIMGKISIEDFVEEFSLIKK